MAMSSAAFMDPHQKPPSQSTCSLCRRPKHITQTGIGVCVICDTDNEDLDLGVAWPNDYIAWFRGMPYPEPYEK